MTDRTLGPELAVVIPCFNEEEVLPELLAELDKLDRSLPFPVRFLFIDDGSTDGTWQVLETVCREDPRFASIALARNFGHQTAVSAGLQHAEGDIVAIIDADLQDPPSVIPAFVDEWRRGYDVVYGIRNNRKEGLALRAAYALFYRILKQIAHIDVPLDAGDFSLMDRRVVDEINRMPEHNRFIRGLRGWVGFRQTGVSYERHARAGGVSKYNFRKLVKLAFDGLVSFSAVPLRIASWLGVLAAALGFIYLLYALAARVTGASIPEGWTSTVITVLFLGGTQLMVLGILGDYIGRIFDEVKGRPHFVQRESVGWVADRVPVDRRSDARDLR